MGLFKKIGNFVGDIAKSVAYVVAAPVNSITGHEFNPDYKTKLGQTIGESAELGIDNIHTLGKSYADTITGGLASKLANTVRADDKKESIGNYLENNRTYESSIVKAVAKPTNKVSGILGTAVASGVKSGKSLGDSVKDAIVPTALIAAGAGETSNVSPDVWNAQNQQSQMQQYLFFGVVGLFLLVMFRR